eukprot:TRINITY_DN162229_c0_g1_i1.p2 TRINITY_DN162229_c0_g1~~TRINITY_DN162229_c0_g1_i1.p2  ORF type:complete len:106 (+),score=1.50 TRINITY_DN162229_c0_g1_i1:68-385(+)
MQDHISQERVYLRYSVQPREGGRRPPRIYLEEQIYQICKSLYGVVDGARLSGGLEIVDYTEADGRLVLNAPSHEASRFRACVAMHAASGIEFEVGSSVLSGVVVI